MSRRPRWRRRWKWAALAITAAAALAWFASGWTGLSARLPVSSRLLLSVSVGGGQLGLGYESWSAPRQSLRADLRAYRASPRTPRWFFQWYTRCFLAGPPPLRVEGQTIMVPFWPAIPVLAAGTAWFRFRDRRRSTGECGHCGYDLTGTRSGPCPECGAVWKTDKAKERGPRH